MSALAPYERLAELLERQLQLVGEGRLDELEGQARLRAQLIASLPETPPVAAREALRLCELMAKRVRIELLRVREDLILRAAHLQQAQRAARGYSPARGRGRRVSASA